MQVAVHKNEKEGKVGDISTDGSVYFAPHASILPNSKESFGFSVRGFSGLLQEKYTLNRPYSLENLLVWGARKHGVGVTLL